MNTEQELQKFILSEILKGEDASQLGSEDNLIDSGVLDSLAMMQIVTHVEKTYAISVDTEDLVPETFESVRALSEFIARKQNSG